MLQADGKFIDRGDAAPHVSDPLIDSCRHSMNLSPIHAGEQLDELVDGRAVSEVLVRGGQRNPRADENPCR